MKNLRVHACSFLNLLGILSPAPWSALPLKQAEREAAGQRCPAGIERKNRGFCAKRQAVWLKTQSAANRKCAMSRNGIDGIFFWNFRMFPVIWLKRNRRSPYTFETLRIRVASMSRHIVWLDAARPTLWTELQRFIPGIEKQQGIKITCVDE